MRSLEVARIVPAEEALAGANIPTLDPHTMVAAEIREAIGAGPRCEFRYTGAGGPVLAVGMPGGDAAGSGVVKVNGSLVLLKAAQPIEAQRDLLLSAGPIRTTISPDGADEPEEADGARRRGADMIFEIDERLKVGYHGYLDCLSEPPTRPARP